MAHHYRGAVASPNCTCPSCRACPPVLTRRETVIVLARTGLTLVMLAAGFGALFLSPLILCGE